jgi:DNA-binding transcriptional regulator YiaG
MKELNQKLAIVQTKLKTKKTSYNAFGKYYFRKAEDILEAIKPFLLEQGVSVTINEQLITHDPVPTLQSTATITDGKDAIHATAIVGVDLNQKGMQTAQQFGAASSYGKKYALGNLFLIDDTADADSTNEHGKSNVVSKIKKAALKPITDEQMKKAKEYIAAGGVVEPIRQKYKLTDKQFKELVEVQKKN